MISWILITEQLFLYQLGFIPLSRFGGIHSVETHHDDAFRAEDRKPVTFHDG